MTQLLAISFDCPTSPSIRLRPIEASEDGDDGARPYGWGLAWYPSEGNAAMVIKDPTSRGHNALTNVLSDWERFSSTIFVAHLRGAAKRRIQQDTHPFVRSYGGRDWVITHNGDLRFGFREALKIDFHSPFEPVGQTDTEHVLCWLLDQIRRAGAKSLVDVGWPQLHGWLAKINELGTLNLVLTDGTSMIAYSDGYGYRPLAWTRRTPPRPLIQYESNELTLQLGGSTDVSRTSVIVSTQALTDNGWSPIEPGTMLVACRGDVVWITEPAMKIAGAAGAVGTTDQAIRTIESYVGPEIADAATSRDIGDDYGSFAKDVRIIRTVHETRYTYDVAVEKSYHLFRLRPIETEGQRLLAYRLSVTPRAPQDVFDDVFGNHNCDLTVGEPFTEMVVRAESIVRLEVHHHPRMRAGNHDVSLPVVWMPWQRQMMLPYLLPPELPETQLRELSAYAMSFAKRQDHDVLETLRDINNTIFRDYEYKSNSTDLQTTAFDVYSRRRGVCQDFANLFIALARLMSIPARYRVGYIYTGENYLNVEQGDASHAWVEVYIPFVGWRGFDPTNGIQVGRDHVRVACGRNFRDATPTSGTIYRGGRGERLEVFVQVRDVTDTPDAQTLGEP